MEIQAGKRVPNSVQNASDLVRMVEHTIFGGSYG